MIIILVYSNQIMKTRYLVYHTKNILLQLQNKKPKIKPVRSLRKRHVGRLTLIQYELFPKLPVLPTSKRRT